MKDIRCLSLHLPLLALLGCGGVNPSVADQNLALRAQPGTRFTVENTVYTLEGRSQRGGTTVVKFKYDTATPERSGAGLRCRHQLGAVVDTYNRRGSNTSTQSTLGQRYIAPGNCMR